MANPEQQTSEADSYFETSKLSVREQPAESELAGGSREQAKRPAHPSNRLIAQLNERWRVVDDPLQWILQRKKGNPRKKNSGWGNRSFCRTRDGLLRCIREYCCSPDQGQSRCIWEYNGVDKVALQQLHALPDWHPDWDGGNQTQNLDVPETDQAHAERQATPLLPQASEVFDANA